MARGNAFRYGLMLAIPLVLAACSHGPERSARELTGGDPERASSEIRYYGCGSCHTIPGVPGANGVFGPSLAKLAQRAYIAGVLVNTPENLMRWIKHPRQVDSLTAMPEMGVTDRDARDIASYLYTLR